MTQAVNLNATQQKAYVLVQKAKNGDSSAIAELCSGIYGATAGRLGTDKDYIDGILSSADSETLALIMDNYGEVTGSEIYKDIGNELLYSKKTDVIDKLDTAYKEAKGTEYTGDDDGKLTIGQTIKSVGKGLLNKLPSIGLTVGGVVLGKTAIGACISGAAGAVLTGIFGAGAAAVATFAAPVIATVGIATAGYMLYKGVTQTAQAVKDGQNATTDDVAQNAVTQGTEGVVDVGLGAYTGYQSVKAFGESVKNVKEYKVAQQHKSEIEAEAKARIEQEKLAAEKAEQAQREYNRPLEESLSNKSAEESAAVFEQQGLTDEEIEFARKLNNEEMLNMEDDGILGYDYGIYGQEGLSGNSVREDMRQRILSGANLADDSLQVVQMDSPANSAAQLSSNSKYYTLGEARLNSRTNEYVHICENLRDMPDYNGVRGKTPLFGKNDKGLKFRLGKIKASGIDTIIDLRSAGECSSKALQTIDGLGMKYVNFPVEDGNWTLANIDNITDYINAINSGDFYVGCANGQARTDLAVAINYILNPSAKNVPALYYGNVSSSRVSIKDNIQQICSLINGNPNVVQNWGWNNYSEFSSEVGVRLSKLLQSLN